MTKRAQDSTHDKILKAAKKIFFEKGFDGTRTRDIAQEADVNLAMLNYHFKSKEQLFQMVMLETISNFIAIIKDVLENPDTDFETKLEILTAKYIDKFSEEPQLPFFVISQLNKSGDNLAKITHQFNSISNSVFIRQYQEGLLKGNFVPVNFVHILMNIGGLVVFPFLISPALTNIVNLSPNQMKELMQERKTLTSMWLKQMILK